MVFAKSGTLAERVEEIEAMPGYPVGASAEIQATIQDQEPFNFKDGISQPFVEGLDRPGEEAGRLPVKPGEFVLGYLNEYGKHAATPSVATPDDPKRVLPRLGDTGRADIGRNGTFLVLRKLSQDIKSFSRFVAGDELLAARMVGRWKNGAPLVVDQSDPGVGNASNDFGYYREDPHGMKCPIGSHIRRANPRDALADPAGGVSAATALAQVNLHRILRRGRMYSDGEEQGIVFVCLNTNIERQFEFIQHTWLMGREFGGLHDETDPLTGNVDASGRRAMTIQKPLLAERRTDLGQFVCLKGGGYYFLPGLTALRYLAG